MDKNALGSKSTPTLNYSSKKVVDAEVARIRMISDPEEKKAEIENFKANVSPEAMLKKNKYTKQSIALRENAYAKEKYDVQDKNDVAAPLLSSLLASSPGLAVGMATSKFGPWVSIPSGIGASIASEGLLGPTVQRHINPETLQAGMEGGMNAFNDARFGRTHFDEETGMMTVPPPQRNPITGQRVMMPRPIGPTGEKIDSEIYDPDEFERAPSGELVKKPTWLERGLAEIRAGNFTGE